MNINQSQAVEMMQQMLFVAQKIRSNATEALAGRGELNNVDLRVLMDILPSIFGDDTDKINLVKAMKVYADKAMKRGQVEPIDFYNALLLCHKEPAFSGAWILMGHDTLPLPLEAMIALQKSEVD